MSSKIQNFVGVMGTPLINCNYKIVIPRMGNKDLSLMIHSTTFPTPGKFNEVAVKCAGQSIYYRTKPNEIAGTWSFQIYENENGSALREFYDMYKRGYNPDSGNFYHDFWQNIELFIYDATGENLVHHHTLLNCYLLSVNPININQESTSQLIDLQVTFRYGDVIPREVGNDNAVVTPIE